MTSLHFKSNNFIIIIIFSFIQTIRLTNCNRLQCTIMQLKQLTRTQMTEILTTNRTDSLQYTTLIAAYKACPPYGTRTSFYYELNCRMSTLRDSNSVPLALCARCYPMRYRAPS